MVNAGTCFKQLSLEIPGVWEHPTAVAKASNEEKEGVGDEEVGAPESIMPARNGVMGRSLTIASPTDSAPADCPYISNNVRLRKLKAGGYEPLSSPYPDLHQTEQC